MQKRISKLIEALVKKRYGLLEKYVEKLEAYVATEAGPQPQGMECINWAGLISDLDRHITNLELELKRKDALDIMTKEVTPNA